jgi:hypothetical protein
MFNHVEETQSKIEERQKRLLQEAETARLLKAIQADRPGLGSRVLANVGDLLIAGGTKLKARYDDSPRSIYTGRLEIEG